MQSTSMQNIPMQSISILGATGSIGSSTLSLIDQHKDKFYLAAITAQQNVEALAELCHRHKPKFAAIGDAAKYKALKEAVAGLDMEIAAGPEGLQAAAAFPADRIMAAIVGLAGLAPTMTAIRQGSIVMLANKECLVSAGDLFMAGAVQANCTILPVDSEHNALFQLLNGYIENDNMDMVDRLVLTASGGPFWDLPATALHEVSVAMALKHPVWSMGAKISVDSASLMNKGLELIEARHLFHLPAEQLDVLVHPQSLVHGLLYLRDGAVLAQLAIPDMKIPIAYCLAYPQRLAGNSQPVNLAALGRLDFFAADEEKFPCLRLAREALLAGGAAPVILNAANEIAVAAFLAEKIGFMDIPALIEGVLTRLDRPAPTALDDIYAIDEAARQMADSLLADFRK